MGWTWKRERTRSCCGPHPEAGAYSEEKDRGLRGCCEAPFVVVQGIVCCQRMEGAPAHARARMLQAPAFARVLPPWLPEPVEGSISSSSGSMSFSM